MPTRPLCGRQDSSSASRAGTLRTPLLLRPSRAKRFAHRPRSPFVRPVRVAIRVTRQRQQRRFTSTQVFGLSCPCPISHQRLGDLPRDAPGRITSRNWHKPSLGGCHSYRQHAIGRRPKLAHHVLMAVYNPFRRLRCQTMSNLKYLKKSAVTS